MSWPTIRWGCPPPGIHNIPIHLGRSKGIFGCAGADCLVTENATGADFSNLLVEGWYDMGHMGTPPLCGALARTNEYSIVGQGLLRCAPFYLLTQPRVRSVTDLRGATIALNKEGTCSHSILLSLLRSNEVDPEDVKLNSLSEVSTILRAVEMGRVDGVIIWEPYASTIERAYGWRLLVDGPTVVNPSNFGFQIFARRSLVAQFPTMIKSFVESYARCVDYARSHFDEAVASCAPLEHAMVEDVARSVRREALLWSSDTSLDFALLERVIVEMKKQRILTADYELTDHLADLDGVVG